jgi:hypothetical protein
MQERCCSEVMADRRRIAGMGGAGNVDCRMLVRCVFSFSLLSFLALCYKDFFVACAARRFRCRQPYVMVARMHA